MKKIIILILIVISLPSCRICCSSSKHYNARNLTDRTCLDVPTIVSIKDVCGKEVKTLADGVYVVTLSNGEHVMIVN